MKWPWLTHGYNLKKHGDYYVSRHPKDETCGRAQDAYIAWWKTEPLGTVDSFAEAEARCVEHEGGK